MRKKIVTGNWKMNTNTDEGKNLIKSISDGLEMVYMPPELEVIVAPPYPYLPIIRQEIPTKLAHALKLSAQDCHVNLKGAFTGDVSAPMLKDIGCDYVILGHSERRKYSGETSKYIKPKVERVLENNMKVIYCCGETLGERKGGKLFEIIKDQIVEGLFYLSPEAFSDIVIAYEPVWAIGTGVTATPAQAEEMHLFLRQLLAEQYGDVIANDTSILYGGSVKPANAKELFSQANVDGGLVGGASLKGEAFVDIIKAIV